MTVIPQDAPRSEDGQWWWDGSTWQPVAGDGAAAPPAGAPSPAQDPSGAATTTTGQISEDGQWQWDGSQWQPAAANGATADPTLYEGDLDVDGWVETLQLALARAGHSVTVDGKFGDRTKDAVVAFQGEHQLEPDGVVGNATWAALMGRAAEPPGVNNPPHGGLYPAHEAPIPADASGHGDSASQTPASSGSDSETYAGYLDVQNFGFGRYRITVADIRDPNKLASLMFPAGKPPSLEISWQVESERGGATVESFDIAHVTLEALTAMAEPFAREIENAVALESLPPTPEETAARQERDRQEQAAFRAAIMPHLDPAGAVTGAMIVDDYTTWAGVHSTQDGWIVWVGKIPGGIEVSGFAADDLDDDERAQVVAQLKYYYDQGMTAGGAELQLQVDFQNDLRLLLRQVALAFIAA